MTQDCIFCKIAKGEIPCYKIYEDDLFISFLDINPSMIGQTIIIPKKHSEYLFDLESKEYAELLLAAKKIAKAIDISLKPIKTGIIIEGLEINHVHIKIYPLTKPLSLEILESKPSKEEMENIANKIKLVM